MKSKHTDDRKPAAGKMNKTSLKVQAWIQARKRHHLSHAQVQMARELGMNPDNLGKLDNHAQEPWKVPLTLFIEERYFKRFGKRSPDQVLSLEEMVRLQEEQKKARRVAKMRRAEEMQ
jgi:hypothetical protein